MKYIKSIPLLIFLLFTMTGCGAIGQKSGSMSTIYASAAIFSFIILMTYLLFVREKSKWFLLLVSSIFVINFGYFILSVSDTLEAALMANRVSYLGSAMLPFSMIFILFDVCKIKYPKWVPWVFFGVSFVVFLVAASPGYSTIYYKEVTLEIVNGVSSLNKTYGPWHSLYLYYLLIYFSIIVGAVIYAIVSRKDISHMHSVILAVAVFVNIVVWLTEQLVKIDFEFLSISYIISESFLLMFHLLVLEHEKRIEKSKKFVLQYEDDKKNDAGDEQSDTPEEDSELLSQCEYFASQLNTLTPTEQLVYQLYVQGKSTKEVLEELNIKENTLKYHNRNIYNKLGISSRKQLIAIANMLPKIS